MVGPLRERETDKNEIISFKKEREMCACSRVVSKKTKRGRKIWHCLVCAVCLVLFKFVHRTCPKNLIPCAKNTGSARPRPVRKLNLSLLKSTLTPTLYSVHELARQQFASIRLLFMLLLEGSRERERGFNEYQFRCRHSFFPLPLFLRLPAINPKLFMSSH